MARRGEVVVKILGDSKNLNRALGRAETRLSKFGRFAGRAGRALAVGVAGVGVAAGAAGVAAVRAFASFDEAMTASTAIMGDLTDKQRDQLESVARDVAKTTKFSATEAAESYFFLASAGLDAAQSMEALPKVAAFAQAGNFDMATATDLLTDAQSALGLSVEDTAENMANMNRVSDALVKANTLANASVEQFSTSLTQKAGGALRNVNKDVEEGVAVLSVFADQGIKAERAGTILRATLDGLSKQARDNAAAFEEHGVQVFDAQGNMRNFADIAADIENATAGMSTEQREATLAQLGFNKRSREGLLALIGNSDQLREYEKELRKAGGTTKDVADKQMDTFNAKLGLLKDRVIDVGIGLGSRLVPVLESAMAWLQDNWPEIEATIREAVEPIKEWFEDNWPAIRDTVVEATTAIVNAVQEHWPEIQKTIADVVDTIAAIVRGVVSVVSTLWRNFGDNILSYVQRVWPRIQQIIQGAMDIIRGIIQVVTNLIKGDWSAVWDGIKQIFRGAWEAIQGLIGASFEQLRLMFTVGLEIVLGIVKGAWRAITSATSAAWNGIVRLVQNTIGAIVRFIAGMPGRIARAARGLFDAVKNQARNAVNGAFNFFRDLPGRIIGVYGRIGSAALGIGGKIVDGIKNGLSNAAALASGIFDAVKDATKRAINSVIDLLNDAIPNSVGWGPASINLPDNPIPRLATGAVLRQPTMAIVGDAGPRNPEIVTPEQLMRRVVREEARPDNAGSVTIGTIQLGGNAGVHDLVRELRWLQLTGGVRSGRR